MKKVVVEGKEYVRLSNQLDGVEVLVWKKEDDAPKGQDLPKAVAVLISALRSDDDYRRTWKDNIAVQFQDAFSNYHKNLGIYDISNIAADNFLKLLCMQIESIDGSPGEDNSQS